MKSIFVVFVLLFFYSSAYPNNKENVKSTPKLIVDHFDFDDPDQTEDETGTTVDSKYFRCC